MGGWREPVRVKGGRGGMQKCHGPVRLRADRTNYACAHRRRRDPSQARDDGWGVFGVMTRVVAGWGTSACEPRREGRTRPQRRIVRVSAVGYRTHVRRLAPHAPVDRLLPAHGRLPDPTVIPSLRGISVQRKRPGSQRCGCGGTAAGQSVSTVTAPTMRAHIVGVEIPLRLGMTVGGCLES